jgi:hypothetical protein
MTIDPRLIERRKEVAEDAAKRNIGRLLRFLGLLVVVGALVWLAFSPWMSVNQVRTAGISVSDANQVLVDRGVVAGTPMVLIRRGAVESALQADPWVRDARVHLVWPNEVIVRVTERVPVAWFETADGWVRRDTEGVGLPSAPTPDDTLPWVRLPEIPDSEAGSSQFVLGAAEFVEALGDELVPGIEIRLHQGELWADYSGFGVRLGRPIEMRAKALGLKALLRETIPAGSTLVLVAPTHPAVSPPSTDTQAGSDSGQPEESGDDTRDNSDNGSTDQDTSATSEP